MRVHIVNKTVINVKSVWRTNILFNKSVFRNVLKGTWVKIKNAFYKKYVIQDNLLTKKTIARVVIQMFVNNVFFLNKIAC